MADVLSTVVHRKALQWDGTNQAQIAGVLNDYAFVSVGGSGELNFTISGNPWSVPANGYVHFDGVGNILDVSVNQGSFDDVHLVVALAADLPDVSTMNDDISALQDLVEGGVAKSVGFATQLIAIGNSNVDVTLLQAMPDTDFNADAGFFGGVGLGSLSVNGTPTVLNTSTVRVPVANSGLAITATVVVLATRRLITLSFVRVERGRPWSVTGN